MQGHNPAPLLSLGLSTWVAGPLTPAGRPVQPRHAPAVALQGAQALGRLLHGVRNEGRDGLRGVADAWRGFVVSRWGKGVYNTLVGSGELPLREGTVLPTWTATAQQRPSYEGSRLSDPVATAGR